MPLFQVDIEKSYQSEFWSNRYIVDVADIAAGVAQANAIVNLERNIHSDLITFTKFRVSTVTPGDDVYVIQALDVPGLYDMGEAVPLPLFNVARVDFNVGTGRPSRKYLRTGITPNVLTLGQFSTTYLTELQDYADEMAAIAAFVDVDGQPVLTGVAFNTIAMRQLRRGSKRPTTPVIP